MPKDHKPGSTGSLNQKLATEKSDETLSDEAEQPELELGDHLSYQKQIAEAEEKANQYWERMLRMQAEMDNTRRRIEGDVAKAHKFGLEKFVLELLPIIDNLERAIEAHHEDEESGDGSLLAGVQLILKMFQNALEKFNVEQVNPQDEPFNPEFHQAVSMQLDPTVAPNTVLKVLQKGYLLNKRLIRPAMVIVSVEK